MAATRVCRSFCVHHIARHNFLFIVCVAGLVMIKSSCFVWLQIVGHSLGGGTAALLTYVLREQKELSTATCVAFAPGYCLAFLPGT